MTLVHIYGDQFFAPFYLGSASIQLVTPHTIGLLLENLVTSYVF